MNKKNKKYYFLAVIIALFILTGNFAYAADDFVDITLDPSGSFGPGLIIDEQNILPGDSFSRKIIITNKTIDERIVMLWFKSDSYSGFNNGLESEILVEIKKSDGSPVFFPFPSGITLKNLYDETLARNFDILEAGTPFPYETYEIFFTFNPLATDQNKNKTKFDLILGVESEVNTPTVLNDDDDDNGNGGGGRGRRRNGGGGGAPPVLGFAGLTGVADPVEQTEEGQGEAVSGTADGITEGVSAEACQSWPFWVWVLALVVFFILFILDTRKNYRKEKYAWKLALVYVLAAVAFWFFFDRCREFYWFLYGSIIIALIVHFLYLNFLKRKIKKITI